MEKDILDLDSMTKEDVIRVLDLADEVKKTPGKYSDSLHGKTLLMLFEKPSLRTRVSFEVAMTQLGGHAIYYDLSTSPMGKKESVSDTAKAASRFVDAMMARLFSHDVLTDLASNSTVPVINGLTDLSHPCQILADLQTIRQKKEKLAGLKLAYVGDGKNNVTTSLILGCAMAGIDIYVGCPAAKAYMPTESVLSKARELAKESRVKVYVTDDPYKAVEAADIVYTDSWMSYHIPKSQEAKRIKALEPYRVDGKLMGHAKRDAIFMHPLPAMRGMEVSPDVIDGPQSVVFDEAENRLHAQKALLLSLLATA